MTKLKDKRIEMLGEFGYRMISREQLVGLPRSGKLVLPLPFWVGWLIWEMHLKTWQALWQLRCPEVIGLLSIWI